ncbi:MAG: uberolysin/carnocyclin family circular bacteriocin [Firmicutes bacterium]|nr:uberolysin/carnocyclin family circular bacteriocin [Bacillota bacterium]
MPILMVAGILGVPTVLANTIVNIVLTGSTVVSIILALTTIVGGAASVIATIGWTTFVNTVKSLAKRGIGYAVAW